MKKMSRKWARASIILMGIFCGFMLLGGLLNNSIVIAAGVVFIIPSFLIKYFVLRCPACGWGGAPPQWTKSGTIHCPKCGAALEYDE